MARVVGRLERPEERHYNLRCHLMVYYAVRNPDFMSALSAILERYRAALAQLAVARFPEEVLSYYWYPRHDQGWAKACVVANVWLDLKGYPRELLALAEEWGLRCDWAAPWLHACLMQHLYPDLPSWEEPRLIPLSLITDLDSIFESVRGEDVICVKVRYKPTPPKVLRNPSGDLARDLATADLKRDFITPRQKTKEDALNQLEEQMNEIDARYAGRGYSLRDTEPELATHIHWLYLRICPQPDTRKPLGWSGIKELIKKWESKYEYVTPSAIQKAVEPLAAELGIELPYLKTGRPPNS